ncbi:hypothetical protein H696_00297 [Fonticula alba]|uniref:Activating signal cointegrator 1 complex subunit 3 n=1 Tax=Fonticula alba TaxID=691883 RepID=A0A058ZEC1_FONAL|nr:hypothetical protein H696_00297 [Fonticula alba]KCV72719.1 hypothetical protein H696_00297 [Fonticula alba]|eukprot:XP_009492420.1 hypothetical protein H696_00297 [Fonticula alba]
MSPPPHTSLVTRSSPPPPSPLSPIFYHLLSPLPGSFPSPLSPFPRMSTMHFGGAMQPLSACVSQILDSLRALPDDSMNLNVELATEACGQNRPGTRLSLPLPMEPITAEFIRSAEFAKAFRELASGLKEVAASLHMTADALVDRLIRSQHRGEPLSACLSKSDLQAHPRIEHNIRMVMSLLRNHQSVELSGMVQQSRRNFDIMSIPFKQVADIRQAGRRLIEGVGRVNRDRQIITDTSSLNPMSLRYVDRTWLMRFVASIFGNLPTDEQSDIALSLMKLLQSDSPALMLESELVAILGYSRLEAVASLLENQRGFLAAIEPFLERAIEVEEEYLRKQEAAQNASAPKSSAITLSQVTIRTTEDIKQSRAQKSAARRNRRAASRRGGSLPEESLHNCYVRALGYEPIDPYSEAAAERLRRQQAATFLTPSQLEDKAEYPNVFRSASSQPVDLFGRSFVLPAGSVVTHTSTTHEISIPPPATAERLDQETDLVDIDQFDPFARRAFPGYESLNRLQSFVFPVAYHSNENMLVSAPTGAGKTDVAMMTVLRELKEHVHMNVIQNRNFKIVYVTPMKALASEIVQKFSQRLGYLNFTVRELSGDMHLTKSEIESTQMIVTTPEKWDIITRKSGGDTSLTSLVKLLIIDEIHLLNDPRGSVIETLVARTLRQVESSQTMIRIIGLSATLPNFVDVARFLRADLKTGLFFFDSSFRPVPLYQKFIGIKGSNQHQVAGRMEDVCYSLLHERLKAGKQVMIFVHSRKQTVIVAQNMLKRLREANELSLVQPENNPDLDKAKSSLARSSNADLQNLAPFGIGFHNAGMARPDRNLVESLFAKSALRMLVCTATLAWGVNLPASCVIIFGTQLYDADQGGHVDLSILDVQQIFGRAGRPQYKDSGEGIILTSADKVDHYVSRMLTDTPIESRLGDQLPDNLNAEIVLGTVTNIPEAITWLRYTYLYERACRNPMAYGISYDEFTRDPHLYNWSQKRLHDAAEQLDKSRMIRYDRPTGQLSATALGRTASHFYIPYQTVEIINDEFKANLKEPELLALVCKSTDFKSIQLREEEQEELSKIYDMFCFMEVKNDRTSPEAKVNILIQAYIRRYMPASSSLSSDQLYVAQNAARIFGSLLEIAIHKGWLNVAFHLLQISLSIERRIGMDAHPIRQFSHVIPVDILTRLEESGVSDDDLFAMTDAEIGELVRRQSCGSMVKAALRKIPFLDVVVHSQPLSRNILRIECEIQADFEWDRRYHTEVEPFFFFIQDSDSMEMHHSERWILNYKARNNTHTVVFLVPIREPVPSQYSLIIVSSRWLNVVQTLPISFKHLILPDHRPPHTELLSLDPLPVTALGNDRLMGLYLDKGIRFFNTIQTQIFHALFHGTMNVLLGAPTGSGKTIAAELAMWQAFRRFPESKVVYIAPLKALVRERMDDWSERLHAALGMKTVELTGETAPDIQTIRQSNIIVTTPEKWDGISRGWKRDASFLTNVSLVIMDEVHLLGQDRGPILEVIVSRMNQISERTGRPVRFLGLSTALSNAQDVAAWMGVPARGLFNFKPAVRPVPIDINFQGFPGKHYCPRMALMNKPAFDAIRQYSPEKPVLVFVSSRRQTRLTAQDLLAYLSKEDNPFRWRRNMSDLEFEEVVATVKDDVLSNTLAFGIGLHHAGLCNSDRKLCERLFNERKIQVLIATSTLAWGVNTPAYLVIIKGTEYFDPKTHRYVDMSITDIMQMMGRAGRPQFDDKAMAFVMVQDVKKDFYKKFLTEPFPVESSLPLMLPDHFNAEIVIGTITDIPSALAYLSATYYFHRLCQNPSYYGVATSGSEDIQRHLHQLTEQTLVDLKESYCITVESREGAPCIMPTELGRVASTYYVSHRTIRTFADGLRRLALKPDLSYFDVLVLFSKAHEFSEIPMRHNEEMHNFEVSEQVPYSADPVDMDLPHVKTHLLLQAYILRLPSPIKDYEIDTKLVVDQAVRVFLTLIDVCVHYRNFRAATLAMRMLQAVKQQSWFEGPALAQVPGVTDRLVDNLRDVTYPAVGEYGLLHLALKAADAEGLFGAVARPGTSVPAERQLDVPLPFRTHSRLEGLLDAVSRQPRAAQFLRSLPLVRAAMQLDLPAGARSADALPPGAEVQVSLHLSLANREDIRAIRAQGIRTRELSSRLWVILSEIEVPVDLLMQTPAERAANVASLVADMDVQSLPKPANVVRFRDSVPPPGEAFGEIAAMRTIYADGLAGAGRAVALRFTAPEEPGVYHYNVSIINDTYRGMEHSYTFAVTVLPRMRPVPAHPKKPAPKEPMY